MQFSQIIEFKTNRIDDFNARTMRRCSLLPLIDLADHSLSCGFGSRITRDCSEAEAAVAPGARRRSAWR